MDYSDDPPDSMTPGEDRALRERQRLESEIRTLKIQLAEEQIMFAHERQRGDTLAKGGEIIIAERDYLLKLLTIHRKELGHARTTIEIVKEHFRPLFYQVVLTSIDEVLNLPLTPPASDGTVPAMNTSKEQG